MLRSLIVLLFFMTALPASAWNTPTAAQGQRVTGWTWTGAVSNDWNNPQNWCGSFLNNSCRGQTTAPTAASVVVFNDMCTLNCAPIIPGNISVKGFNMQPTFTGTIDMNGFNLAIGTAGFYQGSGTFLAGSGKVQVGTTTVSSDFVIEGGTFTGGSGDIQVGIATNAYQTTGGVFSAKNCNLTLPSGNLVTQTKSITLTSLLSFNNSGGLLQIESPSNFANVSLGNRSFNNVRLVVGGGKRIVFFSDFSVDGDLYIDGEHPTSSGSLQDFKITLTQGDLYRTGYNVNGNTAVKFVGLSEQLVDMTGMAATATELSRLEIENPAMSGSVRFVANPGQHVKIMNGIVATATLGAVDLATYTYEASSNSIGALYNAPLITFNDLLISATPTSTVYTRLVVAADLTYTSAVTTTYAGAAGVISIGGDVFMQGNLSAGGSQVLFDMVGSSAQTIDTTGSTFGLLPGIRFSNPAGVSFAGAMPPSFTGSLLRTIGATATMPSLVKFRAASTVNKSNFGVSAFTFNNVTFEAQCRTIDFGEDLNIGGDLVFENEIASTLDGVGKNINLTGNLSVTSLGLGMGGTAKLRLIGPSQTVDFRNHDYAALPNVEIDSSGTVTFLGVIDVLGSNFTNLNGTITANASTMRFNLASVVTPKTMEFGNVDFKTYSNDVNIVGDPLIVRGSLSLGSTANGSTRYLNAPGVDVYGDLTYYNLGLSGTAPIRMKGLNSILTVAATANTASTIEIAKNAGQKVSLGSAVAFTGTKSLSLVTGSLDLAAPANTLTLATGTLTLATGTTIKLSGSTITRNSVNIPAGSYSGGTIVP